LIAGELDPIEFLMESLFDFLSALEFRPRFLHVRIAFQSLQQNRLEEQRISPDRAVQPNVAKNDLQTRHRRSDSKRARIPDADVGEQSRKNSDLAGQRQCNRID
jgi:hypothetical protein